jgi:hypothetical protein
MTSEAPNKVRRSIEVGGGFPGVLLGSQALRWMRPEIVLGDVVVLHLLYLAAKPSHVGLIWMG